MQRRVRWSPGRAVAIGLLAAMFQTAAQAACDLSTQDLTPPGDIAAKLSAHAAWISSEGERGEEAFFSRMDLRGADFSGRTLDGVFFIEADLTDADFSGASLRGAVFTNATLSDASFAHQWDPQSDRFIRTDLSGASFYDACLERVRFNSAILDFAELGGADLRNAELAHVSARSASFNNADLRGTSFLSAELIGADLNHAELDDADLKTDFWQADLRGVIYSPSGSPFLPHLAFARNLHLLNFGADPTTLMALRKAFQDAGYGGPARAITHAIMKRGTERYLDYMRLRLPLDRINRALEQDL